MRILISFLLTVLWLTSTPAPAEEPLVFISAFASGEKGAIHAFHFDTKTGILQQVERTTGIRNPFFLAISPDQKFLYATDAEKFGGAENGFVAAYAIEGHTGRLQRLNQQSSNGRATCYLNIDASGRTVVLANYSSGSVAALPVQKDGSLGEVASFLQHTGTSDDPARQKGPNVHSIVVSPDTRFALAADLGLDKIMIYRLDAATATLTPNESLPFVKMAPGSGPRHIVFYPGGRRVYVISEVKDTVTFFDYTPDTGSLAERQTISTLPAGFDGKSYCADLKITPDGRFLYGTNRGHDSIAIFRIGEDGQLTLLGHQPSLGKGPQNLLITPDGQWLLCANMPGNNVVVFRIDAKTGGLEAVGAPVEMPMPSCIRWLP
jgi:6-phosphogluconolactonase